MMTAIILEEVAPLKPAPNRGGRPLPSRLLSTHRRYFITRPMAVILKEMGNFQAIYQQKRWFITRPVTAVTQKVRYCQSSSRHLQRGGPSTGSPLIKEAACHQARCHRSPGGGPSPGRRAPSLRRWAIARLVTAILEDAGDYQAGSSHHQKGGPSQGPPPIEETSRSQASRRRYPGGKPSPGQQAAIFEKAGHH